MNYYKGLYLISSYNVGIFGGWRCGKISIDGHYKFITDLKEFVVWKFGDYANLVSIIKVHEEPDLTEIEHHFCNDVLLGYIRQAMSNEINLDLTDISDPIWDNVYGDTRVKMLILWDKLKRYEFFKHNVSLNIHYGDTIRVASGREFKVNHYHDIKSLNKDDDNILVKRYDYFPEINIIKP